jgi:hypothetical protein
MSASQLYAVFTALQDTMEQLLSNDKPRTPVHSPRGSSQQQQQQQQQQQAQEQLLLQSPISAATEGDPTLLVAHYAAAIAAAPPQVCVTSTLMNCLIHLHIAIPYKSYSAICTCRSHT